MLTQNVLSGISAACALLVAGNALAQPGSTTRGLAYIVNNTTTGTVSVIDNSTYTLVATIPVGNAPSRIAATPDGSEVFVTNQSSGTVSAISTLTTGGSLNTQVQTITVGSQPGFVTVLPNGKQAYVANAGDNTVSVIDVASNTLAGTIATGGLTPRFIAASPDSKHVFVGYSGTNQLSDLDTATMTDVAEINVDGAPRYFTISPDSTQVYVALNTSNEVAVVDVASDSVLTTVPAGERPSGIAITPDGSEVFVVNLGAGTTAAAGSVTSFETSNDATYPSLSVGPLTWQAVMSHDGTTVYTASSFTNSLYAIDVASGTVKAKIGVGVAPYWATISDPDGTVYVTNPVAGTVSVVNSITDQALVNIPTGKNPWSSIYVNAPVQGGSGPPPPQVLSVAASKILQGNSYTTTVQGSGFEAGATLAVGPAAGVTLSDVDCVSAGQIQVTITATSAARTGPRSLTLTNPDGTTATLAAAFRVAGQ